jgi:hypothetical protein
VRQVVEHQDEIGLDEGGRRDADRIVFGQRHRRLEHRDGVVRQRPDGAAGEARHPLGRLDAAAGDEGADGVKRVDPVDGVERQVGCVGRHRHRPCLDTGLPVADLQEAARADAEERIAAKALAALDRLKQVGRPAVVEAQEGADGRLEVGRARGAQEDGVGVGGVALGLRQADRIGCAHRSGLENQERPYRPGTKGRAFRGATLIRRCRTCVTDGRVLTR